MLLVLQFLILILPSNNFKYALQDGLTTNSTDIIEEYVTTETQNETSRNFRQLEYNVDENYYERHSNKNETIDVWKSLAKESNVVNEFKKHDAKFDETTNMEMTTSDKGIFENSIQNFKSADRNATPEIYVSTEGATLSRRSTSLNLDVSGSFNYTSTSYDYITTAANNYTAATPINDETESSNYNNGIQINSKICMQSTTITPKGVLLHWPQTEINVTTTSDEICLQENALPVTRTCLGNLIGGGIWSEVNGTCEDIILSSSTVQLHSLLHSKDVMQKNLSKSLLDITRDLYNVTSFEIDLVSRILRILSSISTSAVIEDVVEIVNNVMHFDLTKLKQAQKLLNSTDILLYSLDESLIHTKMNDQNYEIAIKAEKLLIQEINLDRKTNARGMKLISSLEANDFNKSELKTMKEDENITENGLEVAIIISEEFKDELRECTCSTTYRSIVTTIFFDDVLFNSDLNVDMRPDGKIVSLIAPGCNCNFTNPLKVIFKSSAPNGTQLKCASWVYGLDSSLENIKGKWTIESNSTKINNSHRVCEFTHITHFALLMLGQTTNTIGDTHRKALDIITGIGSGLSLLGLSAIFLTAIVFRNFRSSNGVVINFSIAIAAQIILLFLADNVTQDEALCTVLGVLLHYTVLVQFLWMSTIAFLQYKRYVLIFSSPTSHLIIKSCAFCWAVPLIPIIVIVSISTDNYGKNSYGLCYALGNSFIFGILLPVGIILFFNLFIFLRILMSITSSRKLRTHRKINDTGILQLRLAVMLYFLLGLTWGFGLLAASGGGIVYAYLFCITATLQGFVLFLYFVVLNDNTRKLWADLMPCKKFCENEANDDSASNTMMQRRGRYTDVSETGSESVHSRMLQKYKNRSSSDF